MNVHVVIVVWGTWHSHLFAQYCLPSLLAPGNLPALAARHILTLRILTTEADVAKLEAVVNRYSMPCRVEVTAVSNETAPSATLHQRGWLQAVEDAEQDNAFLAVVHPDTMWSNGSFTDLARRIDRGADVILKAILGATSESLLPELQSRYPDAGNGEPLAFSGRELVAMGVRHLHPYYASLAGGSPHGRLSVEGFWDVPGEGLLIRRTTVETFALRPGTCKPNMLFCPAWIKNLDRVEVVTDSDEMMTLTMAPLLKYALYFESLRHPTDADWAKLPTVPVIDSPANPQVWRHNIMLHHSEITPSKWRDARRRADSRYGRIRRLQPFLRLHSALLAAGCRIAARLLAYAVQRTAFVARVRMEAPITVLTPSDAAIEQGGLRSRLEALSAPGREGELMAFLRRHIRQSPAGTVASQTIPFCNNTLAVFDDAELLYGEPMGIMLPPAEASTASR